MKKINILTGCVEEFKKLPIKGSDANDLSNFLRFIFQILVKCY